MDIFLPVAPPRVTAQQKRVKVVAGKPRFFHGARLLQEQTTWAALLQEHRPSQPMLGPIELVLILIYPHLKSTSKKHHHRFVPKTTKPDAGNVSKHLEDTLARLRFIEDDAKVARLTVEKWHGPEASVGIGIHIYSLGSK